MSRPFASLLTCLLALGAFACKRTPPEAPEPTFEPTLQRSRLAAPRPIASGSSFDLVPLSEGALLVWGRPSRLGGGVQVVELDAWGATAGAEVLAFAPPLPPSGSSAERIAEDALEIDASVARGSVAVVWVARLQLDVGLKSMFGNVESLEFAAPVTLGTTTRAVTGARGWAAVAASDEGRFQALVRLEDAPCESGGSRSCAQIGVAEIRATQAVPAGVPLAVPDPCAQVIVGAAWVGSRFHYGVCSMREGAQVTTAYTIETDAQVARTDEVLPGCQPDGFLSTGDELMVPGRCAGGRAGARMPESARGMRALPMDDVRVSCEGRVPVIQTAPELGATVRLTAPLDHLEALLPQNVAQAGSRAVFTGKTVLIAQSIGGEVALHRFDCDRGQFIQTDFM